MLKGHILIVDDAKMHQLMLRHLLEGYGLNVTAVNNGQEALEFIQAIPTIDLVLMDLSMPVLGGIDATAELRSRNYGGPIIALTADNSTDNHDRFIAAGGDGYVTKPVDSDDLLAVLTRLLEKP